jgi:hypothetical protein
MNPITVFLTVVCAAVGAALGANKEGNALVQRFTVTRRTGFYRPSGS